MINSIVVLVIFIIGIFYFFLEREKRKLKSNIYKIGKISNNLGEVYYKICAKKNNSNHKFIEFENFPIIRSKIVAERISYYAHKNYETKKEAELELKELLIYLGKTKFKKNIEI